jgi:hypothetical protein
MVDLTFHHLGLAVISPEHALKFLGSLGYRFGEEVHDPLQRVILLMCHHDTMPEIEVIWADGGNESPIGNLIKKRDGLVYHMCYSSGNVMASLAQIEQLGLRVIPAGEPKPAVLFDGLLVSFYHVQGVGLVEIIHK